MLFSKIKRINGKGLRKSVFLLFVSFLVIISSGIFWEDTKADIISRGPKLQQVGPINDTNGFPLWYKDSNGIKQELCLDLENDACGLVTTDFDPTQPISFPDNYPGEAFYQLAEASMSSADGRSDVIGTFALEATFNSEAPKIGDQTVFARIRFRIDSLKGGETYTITHPYGVDEIVADTTDNEIRYVEDVGAGQGFDGAINGRIGTFLKAVSPAPPPGYVGNPNVEQTVTGGVNNQNYFRVEGPGIGLVYPDFACSSDSNNCIETNLFSLAGKIAVNDGLDIQQATYSQSTQGGAIDVFVSSETEQNIEATGDGIVKTALAGGNGQYFAHIPYTGAEPPAKVTLTNTDDNPDTVKTIILADRITATASYDTDKKEFTITAKSSDEVDPPTLTVKGFGDIEPSTGTLVISNLSYVPPTITITSVNKGTVTIPVNINSAPVQPVPVEASAGVDQTVATGGSVTLDGSASTGPIETYLWEQVSGPENIELSSSDTAKATFTAPATSGEYVFKLTITGPFVTSTSTTKVMVEGSQTSPEVTANAGPDQTSIKQGTVVTLDGSGSENAVSYSWKQVSGKTVTLSSSTIDKPTFTFSKQLDPVVFELTVHGADGKTAVDTVAISTVPDNPTVSVAQYRTSDRSWRIDGQSDVFGPGVNMTIYVVDSAHPDGQKLGAASVDSFGSWRFRASASNISVLTGGTLTVVSTSGGKLTNYPVTIRR